MKYRKENLLFTERKLVSIVGKEDEINNIIEYIKREFGAYKEIGWFEK